MNELDELYETRLNLEERINNFFDGSDMVHIGDRGYQDLLQELDEVNEQIEELEN